MQTILFPILKSLYSLIHFSSLVCFLNNIVVLITQSYLSAAQTSSSLKWLDTCMSTSTMPTFITEALCLVT